MSDETPPASGEFGVGSHVAGYRLDEEIGRGGMAIVFRAYDLRLQRRVALKVMAPEWARDDEFRQRFIRESRAAAAVDHPNIIPIYEAGEAGGALFIAMRFIDGGDVQTLIRREGRLPVGRACDIVTQVASALGAAHAHGLVHRDVKPANMLCDARAAGDGEHVYLSDFGLSKRSLSQSALTSTGEFLGTLNYVAPEQIESRPVDGRTDEYALACSAFEMLTGEPPFRRSETLAIMYAQLSAAPPPVSSARHELPAAVDQVIAKALAKAPEGRYASCPEFAAALSQACEGRTAGGGRAGDGPAAGEAAAPGSGEAAPGGSAAADRPPTVAVRPGELAATGAPPSAHRPGDDIASGPPTRGVQAAGTGRATPGGPGVTDAMIEAYSPGGGGRGSRTRTRVAAVAASIALIGAAGGGYLLLGRGGKSSHASSAVLTVPGCTTKVATGKSLRQVRTRLTRVGGHPFDVAATQNGFAFVTLGKGGLAVMNTAHFSPALIRTVAADNTQGEALTPDQKHLVVTSRQGLTVFRVADLEQGGTAPVGTLTSPGAKHPVEVAVSPDGGFAFVSNQYSGQVSVFNLKHALAAGFGPSDLVGTISMRGKDPVGIAASPDGRYVYVASGLRTPASGSAHGTLTVIDMRKAETDPASSVLTRVDAGCGPARVITSPDGKDVWVTSGGGNALLAFSAAKLVSDPGHALIARVAVGQLPLGLVFAGHGSRIIVADSNRDKVSGGEPNLAVIDVSAALAGKPALIGTIATGLAPRQFALGRRGSTLYVTNTSSGQVEAVNITQLP